MYEEYVREESVWTAYKCEQLKESEDDRGRNSFDYTEGNRALYRQRKIKLWTKENLHACVTQNIERYNSIDSESIVVTFLIDLTELSLNART